MSIDINYIEEYCSKNLIPVDSLIDILEDSTVTTVIRGKSARYQLYWFLKNNLDGDVFDVRLFTVYSKLTDEEDYIKIVHKETGKEFVVKVVNSCRGSFSIGEVCTYMTETNFNARCCKGDFHINETNGDRYLAKEFDLLAVNPLNSIYRGAFITNYFEIKSENYSILKKQYNVDTMEEAEVAASNDWRFVFPKDIAVAIDGKKYLPKTPYIILDDDKNWFKFESLQDKLIKRAKKR